MRATLLRPLLTALVAVAVASVSPVAVHAQDGPAEVFRAFWESRLSPADPAAVRFRSKASLSKLDALRREDPANAADMLEFMAEMHADLQAAAEIESIETTTDADDRATLVVRLQGRNGDLPTRLPSQATVSMVREADGWKIDSEAYSRGRMRATSAAPEAESMPEREDASSSAPSCPAPSTLGDPTAPHVLMLGGTAGEGRVHFADARVRLNEGWMIVELPPFNEHSITIRASGAAAQSGRYEADLSIEGMMGFNGCPTLPSRFFAEDDLLQPAPVGELIWEGAPGSNRANVKFSFADPASGAVDVSGTLQGVPVVDVNAGPLLEGSRMNAAESTVAPTRGSVLHEPGRGSLMIELWYETANESSNEITQLDRFTGRTGLIVEGRWPGTARVALVREFEGTRIDVEVREVPEDALADEAALTARFSEIGKLVARVRSDRVATIPPLPDMTR